MNLAQVSSASSSRLLHSPFRTVAFTFTYRTRCLAPPPRPSYVFAHNRALPCATRALLLPLLTYFPCPHAYPTHNNQRSTLYITGSSHTAAKVMVCTTVSAAAGGLGVACASLIMFQHVGPDQVINGVREGRREGREGRKGKGKRVQREVEK